MKEFHFRRKLTGRFLHGLPLKYWLCNLEERCKKKCNDDTLKCLLDIILLQYLVVYLCNCDNLIGLATRMSPAVSIRVRASYNAETISNYWMRLSMIGKIMQIEESVIRRSRRLLHNSSCHTQRQYFGFSG